MILYNEAIQKIRNEFECIFLEIEEIPLKKALNRTLAEDVVTDINLPPFDNSAMDGYAVRYEDDVREWNVIGEISAGNYRDYSHSPGSAVSIMTGSRLPEGFDTVIPIEDVDVIDNTVSLLPTINIKRGINIRKAGSDIKKSQPAVGKDTFLKSRFLATLASCGKSKVKVYKKLKIAVLATGDELIKPDQQPGTDQIRVSNTYSLCGMIEELHQSPLNLGITGDDFDELKQVIADTLSSDIDILITTGGVSVGKHDYVREVFSILGIEEIFWRMNIKPGKPVYFGKSVDSKLVFGLPGNPVSSLVNFELLIKPFLMELYNFCEVKKVNAVLENDLYKTDKKRHFMRGFIAQDETGNYTVSAKLSQSSGNLVNFSKSNCLIEIEEDRLNPVKGETVHCIMM